MAEYIDKKKIIDKLSEEFDILVEEGHLPNGYLTALSLIETIQAEDVVSVVRCENCVCYREPDDDHAYCTNHLRETEADDYCSYGIRKDWEHGTD